MFNLFRTTSDSKASCVAEDIKHFLMCYTVNFVGSASLKGNYGLW
jgi:hypothetical protein